MSEPYSLSDDFDAVVMLTWSNWRTEPRSNRYHYATRFAKHVPVYFVQKTDPPTPGLIEEAVDGHAITLVHAGDHGPEQTERLRDTLHRHNVRRPLYWIYNPYYHDFFTRHPGQFVVYHATEDYLAFPNQTGLKFIDEQDYQTFLRLLEQTDLAVAVTQKVGDAIVENAKFERPVVILRNGCDPAPFRAAAEASPPAANKIIFYQGGINARLDFEMIHDLLHRLPDWQFWFCGNTSGAPQVMWNTICSHPNVQVFGGLSADRVAELQARATVGIIPFLQMDMIWVSLPLKAYEYVASGLPVVTVPILELQQRPDLFQVAQTAEEFEHYIRALAPTRTSPEHLALRAAAADAASYDQRFAELLEQLKTMMRDRDALSETDFRERNETILEAPEATPALRVAPETKTATAAKRLRILVAYSATSTFVQTTLDYMLSLTRNLDAEVKYLHVTHSAIPAIDLNSFDAIFQSYCARWPFKGYVSPFYSDALKKFAGIKLLAVQDEYDRTNVLKEAIAEHGFDVVLTCVPPDQVERVYPRAQFPNTDFVQVLTGYVPEGLSELSEYAMPLEERPYVIGYRGRDIGGRYGRLAWEKLEIGRRVLAAAEARGLKTDIDWTDARRIYGKSWFKFLGSCRATLGTESGSNVFDFDGSIEAHFNKLKEERGKAPSYEEFLPLVRAQDESMDIGQISPKVFEAAALRTPLILMRGRYSGVVEPGKHYIPLERDYSNLDHVLDQLGDLPKLQAMSERAYEHVVASGKFGYPIFAKKIEAIILKKLAERQADPPATPTARAPTPLPEIAPDDREILIAQPTESPLSHHEFWANYEKTQTNSYRREVVRLNEILASENTRFVEHIQQQSALYVAEYARLTSEINRLSELYANAVQTTASTYEQQIFEAKVALERAHLETAQLREIRGAQANAVSAALMGERTRLKGSLSRVAGDIRAVLAAPLTLDNQPQGSGSGFGSDPSSLHDRFTAIAETIDTLGKDLEQAPTLTGIGDDELATALGPSANGGGSVLSILQLQARHEALRLRNRMRHSVVFNRAKQAHLWQRFRRRVRATPGLGHVATWVYRYVKRTRAP